MSKRVVFNDNEVVTNEDVTAAFDLRSRDLNRELEAVSQGTFLAGSTIGAGQVVAGSVISGLEVTAGSGAVVSVSPGIGFFCLGGADVTISNRFRMFSSEAATNVALSPVSASLTTWYVIEVSAVETITYENRSVLSGTGVGRGLHVQSVPKYIDSSLQFRMRAGTPVVLASALTPGLQPDPAWLPIAAVRMDAPGTTVAQVLDLRKMLAFSYSPLPYLSSMDGFDRPVSLSYASATSLGSSSNCVRMGNYYSSIWSGVATIISINPNIEKSAGSPLHANAWHYVYAYRPHVNCGFTSLLVTSNPPISTGTTNNGRPTYLLSTPAPWPIDGPAPALYMGAVRFYAIAGGPYPYGIREFAQAGNYVAITSRQDVVNPVGANTDNEILNAFVSAGTYTLAVNTGSAEQCYVPPHVRMVRTRWTVTSGATPLSIHVMTLDGFVLTRTNLDVSSVDQFTVDIPLPLGGATTFTYKVYGASANIKAEVLGYYEGIS